MAAGGLPAVRQSPPTDRLPAPVNRVTPPRPCPPGHRRIYGELRHRLPAQALLHRHPGGYSHYVLLDHQDWLARHAPVALEQEWRLILANGVPGGRVLMRSASHQVDFIPEAVREALAFPPDLAHTVHREDRVGTYGSVNLAVVR